jgi:O-antigen ligase
MPITFAWVILIVGMISSVSLSVFQKTSLRAQILSLYGLGDAPLAKPIAIFGAVAFLSGLVNDGVGEAFKSVESLRGMLVYFWAYSAFSTTPRLREHALFLLLLIGSLAGYFATFQQLTGYHPGAFRYLQGTGFLATPMSFAGTMQLFSMLSFGLLVGGAYRRVRNPLSNGAVFAMVLLGTVSGVIFASERSAWIGFLTGLAVSAASLSAVVFVRTLVLLPVVSTIVWFTVPVVRQRIAALFNWQHDVSAQVRLGVWRHALVIFQHHPIFGVGIRKFPVFPVPQAVTPGHAPVLDHAHSNYLQLLATTGLCGLLAYLNLWWQAIRISLKTFRVRGIPDGSGSGFFGFQWRFDQGLAFGIMAGIIALLSSGLFEYNFGTGQIRLTHFYILAMLLLS